MGVLDQRATLLDACEAALAVKAGVNERRVDALEWNRGRGQTASTTWHVHNFVRNLRRAAIVASA